MTTKKRLKHTRSKEKEFSTARKCEPNTIGFFRLIQTFFLFYFYKMKVFIKDLSASSTSCPRKYPSPENGVVFMLPSHVPRLFHPALFGSLSTQAWAPRSPCGEGFLAWPSMPRAPSQGCIDSAYRRKRSHPCLAQRSLHLFLLPPAGEGATKSIISLVSSYAFRLVLAQGSGRVAYMCVSNTHSRRLAGAMPSAEEGMVGCTS